MVRVSVGVPEAVGVAVAAAVFVGASVGTDVGGAGAEVRVQAKEVIIARVKIKSLGLIRKYGSPFGILYLKAEEVPKFS
jgi:hypothetical protein